MGTLKTLFSFFLILTVILLPLQNANAGGYQLAGVGAKALAMAGAYRAVADDWSAMYWNPAGLSGQDNSVSLTVKNLNPIVWLTPDVQMEYEGYSGYRNGVEQTTKAKAFIAGALGVTYGITDEITVGLSVFAPAALGADWRGLYMGPPYGYNNDVPYPDRAWFSDIKVIDIHPTIAYELNDQLSFGLGLSVQYGLITLQTPKLSPTGAPFPYQHFYVDATLEGDGIGYGYNLGMLIKLTDEMRLGIAYKGESTLPIEGDVKQVLYKPNSPGFHKLLDDTINVPLFDGGTLEANPKGSADFPLPQDFGMGIAIDATPNLTVAFDFVWTNWGSVDEVVITMDGIRLDNITAREGQEEDLENKYSILPLYYEDTFKFSFGADMLVYKSYDLHLYAGYYYDPTPIPDGTLRPSITDVSDKHNFSLGFAVMPMNSLVLEGYWEHTFTDSRSIGSFDIDNDGSIDNLAGEWKFQVDTFGLSCGYKF